MISNFERWVTFDNKLKNFKRQAIGLIYTENTKENYF